MIKNKSDKVTILKIDGLKKDITYQISLLFYAYRGDSKIQVSSLGKFVRNDFRIIDKIPYGTSIFRGSFSTPFNNTSFLIRNASKSGMIRLFGVAVSEFNKKSNPTN